MKKNLLYVIVGLFLLATTSCTDESLVEVRERLKVTGGVGSESRTTFVHDEEWTRTHWVAEDAIGLYTDAQSNVAYKATSGGSSNTEFIPSGTETIAPEEGQKVTAYYPYNSDATEDEVPLPYTVALWSNRPAPAFLLGEGTVNNNEVDLKFSHFYAYLKITFGGNQYNSMCDPTYMSTEGGGLYIEGNNPISIMKATYNLKTQKIKHLDEYNWYMMHFFQEKEFKNDQKYTYFIPILPQEGNKRINIFFHYPVKGHQGMFSNQEIVSKLTPKEGIQAGKVYVIDFTQTEVTGEWPQIEALTEFYESTNGLSWYNNVNWLTQKPLENWYGLNKKDPWNKYVYTMNLSNNNLNGILPESFATLMEKATEMDLSLNHLGGKIPESVRRHRNWSKLGWRIVPQDTRRGGGFDLTNSGLMLTEATATTLDGQSVSIKDVCSRNQLTQVICINSGDIEAVMNTFYEDRVNLHLDYQPKGMETLFFTGKDRYGNNERFIEDLQKQYGSVPGVRWLCNYPNFTIYFNMSYLFDSSGQLVYIAPYSTSNENNSVQQDYSSILESYLGWPTKHEKFSFNFYTSTDYSKHGETFTIQKATEGKGIDLVFIGEGFVDTDMGPNGKYETKMKEAADKLFELEPYKSLRNRFNLYGVKVVSPTAEFVQGAEKAIYEDNNKAFELASQYHPNLPEDANMRVVVVYNTPSSVGRSYCVMFSDGDFVTYVMDGINNALIHEAGGHGIARLADEYVEGGYENVSLPDEEKEVLDDALTWDWGWFANIDYNNTKSTVRWSRFLNDSRYADDNLGIFEGAHTYGLGAYRSSDNSMMRYNISWFNAPSREAIYKAVMTLSEGESWTYDYEEFVAFDSKNIGSAKSRSAMTGQTEDEIRKIQENHRKPVFVRGSWRNDRQNAKNNNIIVPLR